MAHSQTAIQRARELWAAGYMRKAIKLETGLSTRAITQCCADLPKPIEHRGRKRKRWNAITPWAAVPDEESEW